MGTKRQQIEEQAATFLQKRDTGPWTPADEAALSAWKEASIAHLVAYLRIEAAWEAMGRLKALGAGLPHRQAPTPEAITAAASPNLSEQPSASPTLAESDPAIAHRRHPAYKTVAVAASLLVMAGLAFGGYQRWFQGDSYATPVGGVASVLLEDGSHITLNTDSRVRVVLGATERHVDLTQGEAFFEVAKDSRRPFVVQAKGTRIIAVGTQFSVRREAGNQVQVLVTEGKVRIAPVDANHGSYTLFPGPQRDMLTAGEAAHIGNDGLKVREEPALQAEDALAWRDGYLVFRDTSLAEAVAEFNRYSVYQIVVQDPEIGAMPLTGKFRATNSEAFINLLERTFHIQAQTASGEIILSRGDSK